MSKKTTKGTKALGAAPALENAGDPPAPETTETASAPKGAVSVDVVNGEQYIRTYSKKVHGADFKALAEEFASKDAKRTLVDSAKIKRLEVSWREKQKDNSYKSHSVSLTADQGADFKEQALALAVAHKGSVTVR